jgi:hypothetical protein
VKRAHWALHALLRFEALLDAKFKRGCFANVEVSPPNSIDGKSGCLSIDKALARIDTVSAMRIGETLL